MYGVGVKFFDNRSQEWSKSYTFKSEVPYAVGVVVVVESVHFYNVGKVTVCKQNYFFKEEMTYRQVLQEVKL
jgi:hypothetical protein